MKCLFMTERSTEKSTEKYLVEQMELLGGEAAKWTCSSRRGKPDRICFFPGGHVAFAEIKDGGVPLEPHQEREHTRMFKKFGILVCTLRTEDDVDRFIESHTGGEP